VKLRARGDQSVATVAFLKDKTVYGLPPILQGLCAFMTGTGLLPYIRPLFESSTLSGLNDFRAYRPYRRVGFF
jgi:hypothetical protein